MTTTRATAGRAKAAAEPTDMGRDVVDVVSDTLRPPLGNQARLRGLASAGRGMPQRKLKIGSVNDPLETEADHVADRVMRSTQPVAVGEDAGGTGVLRRCACQGTKDDELHRKAAGAVESGEAPSVVHQALAQPGRPLDAGARSFFEPRMGVDLGGVRVHTDALAAESARAVNAYAYTVGNDVVFDNGQYAPDTSPGKKLLGHELVHTAQQRGAPRGTESPWSVEPADSPAELQASRMSDDLLSGPEDQAHAAGPTPFVRSAQGNRLHMARNRGAAGGCGICLGDPRLAGIIAHTEIQSAFGAFNPDIGGEVPVPTADGDDTPPFVPRLDLAQEKQESGQTVIYIGEIKPLDDAGEQVGIARRILGDYARELLASGKYGEVFRMKDMPFPLMPFINPMHPPGCPPQLMTVQLTEPGIYQYFCDPAWSDLVTDPACACGKKQPEEKEEEEKEKKKDGEEEEEKKDKKKDEEEDEDKKDNKDDGEERDRDKIRVPPVLIPVAAMAALAAMAVRFGGRRIMAPAAAAAALLLLASGAEASVGGEGDDALEALFKLSQQHGATLPDDLKEAIKNDPELKRVLTEAAKSGNYSAARAQLGEKLTRLIVANRDQFTDAEIEALLSVTEKAGDAIPNANVTVAELHKALDSARGSGGQPPVAGGPKAADVPMAPPADPSPGPVAAAVPAPARRLVTALTSSKGGSALTAEQLARLNASVSAIDPPLTDAEVDDLVQRIGPADGKSAEDLLASIQQTLQTFRTARAAAPAADPSGAQQPSPAPDAGAKNAAGEANTAPPAAAGAPAAVAIDKAARKTQKDGVALSEANQKSAADLDAKYAWIAPGDTYVVGAKDLVFKNGVPFSAFFLSRDIQTTRVVLGKVTVTPRQLPSGGWVLVVPAGAPLYDAAGLWGSTKQVEVPALPNAGKAKDTDAPAKAPVANPPAQ